jgi:hypothetical protein
LSQELSIREPGRPSLMSPHAGRVVESRQLRELVEREHALSPLVAHDPRGIGLHAYLPAEIRTGIDSPRVTLDVRQLGRGGPEPGLLLLARGSPVGSVHDRACFLEVARQRRLVAGRRRRWRREHEGAEDDRRGGDEGSIARQPDRTEG